MLTAMRFALVVPASEPSYWHKIISPEVLPTWILMVVGTVGTIVAVVTLLSIRSQQKDTQKALLFSRKSAVAAGRSANALMSAERAWVVVEMPERIRTLEGNDDTTTIVNLTLKYENAGRTMCWITEKKVHFAMIERLPKEPMFDENTLAFSGPEPEPLVVGQHSSLEIPSLACKGIHVLTLSGEPGGNVPVLYGMIRYRDAFGSDRKTLFGYQIGASGRLKRIHSTSYNDNT
jgi:hypothetical protein